MADVPNDIDKRRTRGQATDPGDDNNPPAPHRPQFTYQTGNDSFWKGVVVGFIAGVGAIIAIGMASNF